MRGRSQKKTTILEVQAVALSRNHQLLYYERGSVDPNTIPQQSYIGLRCLTCNNEWKTKLQVYLGRTSPHGGCRQCYNNNVQNKELYPNSPCLPKPDIEGRPKRRAGKEVQRQAHLNGQFGLIQNRQNLISYLKENPNEHNDFALELIQRDEERKRNKTSIDRSQYSNHHVIPLHAQGSPDSWNIIAVTKAEHDKIHRLRYKVYQEIDDLKATFGTASDLASTTNSTMESSMDDSTEKPKRELANLNKRTEETIRAIEKGMVWTHKDGYEEVIPPNDVSTVNEIRARLINALPVGHVDRSRMEQSSSSKTYIRDHINPVFSVTNSATLSQLRNSAYGFVVRSLT